MNTHADRDRSEVPAGPPLHEPTARPVTPIEAMLNHVGIDTPNGVTVEPTDRDAARRDTFAEVSHAMNAVADVWEKDGSDPCRVRIPREYANAYRAYAEGYGAPTGSAKFRADRDADNVPSDPANAIPVQSIEGGPMMPPEFWQHVRKMTPDEMSRPLDFPRAPESDNVPSDRVRAYAEVLDAGLTQRMRYVWTDREPYDPQQIIEAVEVLIDVEVARAVMAVADREQAALQAQVGRWRGRADRRLAEAEKAEAEVARLRATIARVEAMATAWETPPVRINSIRSEVIAHHLREALRGPEPTEETS